MRFSKRATAGLVGLAAGEVLNGAWNVSYQDVIYNKYNAGYLPLGQIELRSSLFPWPKNGVTSGPFNGNSTRYLNFPETLVYNILGNLAVRVGLIVLPIVYAAFRLYRLNRNSERIGRVNEAADRFSKIHYYDFQGKDPEGKKADAFLAARSFFDTNRRKVSSTEDAIVLLERELRNGSIGTYTSARLCPRRRLLKEIKNRYEARNLP